MRKLKERARDSANTIAEKSVKEFLKKSNPYKIKFGNEKLIFQDYEIVNGEAYLRYRLK